MDLKNDSTPAVKLDTARLTEINKHLFQLYSEFSKDEIAQCLLERDVKLANPAVDLIDVTRANADVKAVR